MHLGSALDDAMLQMHWGVAFAGELLAGKAEAQRRPDGKSWACSRRLGKRGRQDSGVRSSAFEIPSRCEVGVSDRLNRERIRHRHSASSETESTPAAVAGWLCGFLPEHRDSYSSPGLVVSTNRMVIGEWNFPCRRCLPGWPRPPTNGWGPPPDGPCKFGWPDSKAGGHGGPPPEEKQRGPKIAGGDSGGRWTPGRRDLTGGRVGPAILPNAPLIECTLIGVSSSSRPSAATTPPVRLRREPCAPSQRSFPLRHLSIGKLSMICLGTGRGHSASEEAHGQGAVVAWRPGEAAIGFHESAPWIAR
ncbi:unnamed protein product [Urochloa humidicola]